MVCFQSILCGEASSKRLPGIIPAGYASHTGYQYDSISRVAGHRELAPPSKFSKLGGFSNNVLITSGILHPQKIVKSNSGFQKSRCAKLVARHTRDKTRPKAGYRRRVPNRVPQRIVYPSSRLGLKPFCQLVLSPIERAPWRVQRAASALSSTSRAANSNPPQIRSTQSKCSGFIITERKHVILSRSSFIAPRVSVQNFAGKSAIAKCKSRRAAASKILRASKEDSAALAARGAKITMSSSGANAVTKYSLRCTRRYSASAASRLRASDRANSPSFTSGNNFCVAHNAAAAAPGREHSKLISPKCNSAELK